MRIERLSAATALPSLQPVWDRLAAGVPFRRADWLQGWWHHFGESHELFVVVLRNADDDVVGIVPLWLESGPAQGRVLRFLGSGRACSDYLGLLIAPGYDEQVVQEFAKWLTTTALDNPANRWDMLSLEGALQTEPTIVRLTEALADLQCVVHRQTGPNCWRIPLPNSWEEYVSRLSKSYRKIARRSVAAVERGDVVVRAVTDSASLRRGWTKFVNLHQIRRESCGDEGCFHCPDFGLFLRDAVHDWHAAGQLHLQWLEIDETPAAIDLGVVQEGVLYLYQSGMDPKFLERSPGNLLTAITIRQAISRGLTAVDFLRGDEPYKAYWRSEPLPLVELRIVPNRSASLMRHGVWLATERIKDWLKQGLKPLAATGTPWMNEVAVPSHFRREH